jgi:hypothetical protein
VLSDNSAPAILAAACGAAGLLVVSNWARSAGGEPYAGAHARRLLEFADQPYLLFRQPGTLHQGWRSLPAIAFDPGRGRQPGEA